MKKILLFTLFTLTITQAQNIHFPDANLKSALVNFYSPSTPELVIDTNHDGEIQVSEALAITELRIPDKLIFDLTGIEAFANLDYLDCGGNNLATFDYSLPVLKGLNVEANPMTTLNLSGMPRMRTLHCPGIQITSIDLSALSDLRTVVILNVPLTTIDLSHNPYLESITCSQTQLTTLDVSSNVLLLNIACPYNQLSFIDTSHCPILSSIDVSNNPLLSIDLSQNPNLDLINVSNTLLTTLDLSQQTDSYSSYIYLQANDNPNLTQMFLKNNSSEDTYVFNCPNLSYICIDEIHVDTWRQDIYMENQNLVQVNSYCAFAPGGAYNTIEGKASVNIDNNSCGTGNAYFPFLKIAINDGTTTGSTFTNLSGDFVFYTQSGTYTLMPQLENAFFTVSPPSATVNFTTLNETTQTQNFCLSPIGIHNDLEITILSNIPARPGFDATYVMTYKNKGNQNLSGSVNLVFNDTVLDFVSANPATTSQSTDNLNWDFSNLQPFESRDITFTVNANGPMETPPLNIDDVLNYTATISPLVNDETPLDNVSILSEIVTGSFDPNDKTCLEGTIISPDQIGKYVHYLIRFQNSGTAPAEFVVVKDMIDTTKFEMDSFQLTSASHPQTTKITGNKVEFYFQNINLPAEQDDKPGSHGFVAFKIKTKENLVLGNTISNSADIFFDYNFPIVTEPAESTFAVLGINELENASVSVNPNPVTDHLQITSKDPITSIQVFDVQGRLIQTVLENKKTTNLNFEKQQSGVYFVKIHTEKGIKTEKIIKR